MVEQSRRFGATILITAFVAVCLLGTALLARSEALSGPAHNPENLLRLHVLAHSDHPQEQEAKLHVRDALLAELAAWPAPSSPEELERLFRENAHRLVRVAEERLASLGRPHPVRIEIGDFAYDERRSGQLVLPAGTYRSVRVIIGDGAGRNWWCVLFPPLCFVEDSGELQLQSAAAGSGSTGASQAREMEMVPFALTVDEGKAEEGSTLRWRVRLLDALSEGATVRALKDLLVVSWAEEVEGRKETPGVSSP